MSKKISPFVLIDDRIEEAIGGLRDALGPDSVVGIAYPDGLQGEDLEFNRRRITQAKVWLVDHHLKHGKQNLHHSTLQPRNAAGLLAILPSILDIPPGEPRNQARIIYSAQLDDLSLPHGLGARAVPVKGREHVFAKLNDADWIIAKLARDRTKEQEDLRVLEQLADAVTKARSLRSLAKKDPADAMQKLMKLRRSGWHDQAIEQMEAMHPPLQAMAAGDIMRAIRWLLHTALPFPGCLLELRDVALSLRIDPAWLRNTDAALQSLRHALSSVEYAGVLPSFQGLRWWKAGVESLIWKQTDGKFYDRAALHQVASKWTGLKAERITFIETDDPVLLIDDQFKRTDQVSDIATAVQLQPDDWPSAIANPWITIETVKRIPRLSALVVPKDAAVVN